MNENLKKFLEYASQNEDVRQKIDALKEETDKDTVIAKSIEIAKEAGFTLSKEDFAEEETSDELSEDELDAVAGGKKCRCYVGGGGTASKINCATEETCACVGYGQGDYIIYNEREKRCICAFVGEGD